MATYSDPFAALSPSIENYLKTGVLPSEANYNPQTQTRITPKVSSQYSMMPSGWGVRPYTAPTMQQLQSVNPSTYQVADPFAFLAPILEKQKQSSTDINNYYDTSGQNTPKTYTDEKGYTYLWDDLNGWSLIGKPGSESYTDPTTGVKFPSYSDYLKWQQWEWEKSNSATESATEAAYRQQQLALQQQQLEYQKQRDAAQLAAEKEARLAQLAAQPKSWLEYAALAGTTPVIQPWMLPLMPQQYSNLQAGQAIPGYTSTNMQGMPDLINPSAQYLARMGPTAQQQYLAYMQADKAQMPEETEWRLWSQAPPSGSNTGLRWYR